MVTIEQQLATRQNLRNSCVKNSSKKIIANSLALRVVSVRPTPTIPGYLGSYVG